VRFTALSEIFQNTTRRASDFGLFKSTYEYNNLQNGGKEFTWRGPSSRGKVVVSPTGIPESICTSLRIMRFDSIANFVYFPPLQLQQSNRFKFDDLHTSILKTGRLLFNYG
jgi:hypothetical protein